MVPTAGPCCPTPGPHLDLRIMGPLLDKTRPHIGYTIKFSVFKDGILFVCFVNKKHEPLLNLLLLLASSHTFACMVTRLRIRKWLSKGSPTHHAFCWNPKKFEIGKIFLLCKLRSNGWPHSYWSKQITCFDNVVDRWHYRQYFSFPPQKTVKNLAGPGVGGPHSGYTYYIMICRLSSFFNQTYECPGWTQQRKYGREVVVLWVI